MLGGVTMPMTISIALIILLMVAFLMQLTCIYYAL